MNRFDEDEWDGDSDAIKTRTVIGYSDNSINKNATINCGIAEQDDTPPKADDPYAPNEWGLAGGQGHTTKELEESVKALGFGCLCFIIGIAGVLTYMAVIQFMGK